MKKQSSYQKLKEENKKLKSDIFNLVRGSAYNQRATFLRWDHLFNFQYVAMFGRLSSHNKKKHYTMQGIYNKMK